MQISGKAFLVTGAASGLGAATARQLAAAGAKLALVDINAAALAQTQAALGGSEAICLSADVTQEHSVRAAISEVKQAFGGLWGVINCAGIAPAEKLVGREGPHKLESFSRVLNVNLVGTFNVARLAAELMIGNEADEQGERGIIINTASVAAFDGQIGQIAYAASKAGIVGMTLPMARELARSGIRVMTIAPGIMETPMLMGMPQEVQDSLGKMVPFPARLGKPGEYAALAQHIIENTYLNGEVIRLDGSIRLAAK